MPRGWKKYLGRKKTADIPSKTTRRTRRRLVVIGDGIGSFFAFGGAFGGGGFIEDFFPIGVEEFGETDHGTDGEGEENEA